MDGFREPPPFPGGDVAGLRGNRVKLCWGDALKTRFRRLTSAIPLASLGIAVFLAGCALSPNSEVEFARERLYQLCQGSMTARGCASWESSVERVLLAAERHPTDEYAQGQAVFALTRAGALGRARRVVEGCRASRWWCAMLRGHVAAESGSLMASEEAFEEMLSLMPEEDRCAWTDLSSILPSQAWARFSAPDCLEEAERSEVVWWLSDPSHLLAGNEAKVAHYNRLALATLHDDQLLSTRGRVTDGIGHDLTHHRGVLRRGMYADEYDQRWGRESKRFFSVMPNAEALTTPMSASLDAWSLNASGGDVRTEVGFELLGPLTPQVAFFERGDSVLATAAIDLDSGPLLAGGPVREAALMLAGGPASPVFGASTNVSSDRYVFKTSVPSGRYLVSVEAWTGVILARARFGHGLHRPMEGMVRLSDLLLYTAADAIGAESLDEAFPRMRGGNLWSVGERVGMYLEVYDSENPVAYDVTVSLTPAERDGVLGRIGSILGRNRDDPVEVTWRQQPDQKLAVVGLTLKLENLDPGEYVIEVRIGGASSQPAIASRRIEVAGSD